MFGGVEYDLVPAKTVPGVVPAKKQKSPKAWLAGELILRCERQGLTQLPPQLWYKTTVRQLILSGNALISIPADIQALKALQVLKLDHNQLSQLPNELACLEHLEVLELQRNQLQAVPAGLCKLVHLTLMNLDDNPLGQCMAPNGPKLLEVWQGANDQQQQQAQPQQAQPPTTAADEQQQAGAGKPKQVTAAAVAARRAEALAHKQLLQGRTQAVLDYLLSLQAPSAAVSIKQAKLAQLQQAARQQVHKLLRVADLGSLDACAAVARHAGLRDDDLQAVAAAKAATEALKVANASGDMEALTKAIRDFEELCKPGRPGGPEYTRAHTTWRKLQKQALQHGWRAVPSNGADGEPSSTSSASRSPAADIYAPIDRHQQEEGGTSGRRYMTWQERKKQELIQAGAKPFAVWAARKAEQEHKKQEVFQAILTKEQQARKGSVTDRIANAVHAAELEQGWPSGFRQAYPHGTFAPSPEQLARARKAYTPAGLGSLYSSMESDRLGSVARSSRTSTDSA